MNSNSNPEWLPEERKINNKEWSDFRKKYAAELGFDGEPDYRPQFFETQLVDQVPSFRDMINWHLFMPDDSVPWIKEATDPYGVLKEIAKETAENALNEASPAPLDLYFIANFIIGRLTGGSDFQVQGVHSGEYKSYEEHEYAGNDVHENMTVVVTSVNSDNREDCYIYEIEEAPELFGSVLYSATQAAHLIYEADLTPDQVLRDVAFTLDNYGTKAESVSNVLPPEQPISILSTDAHSRTDYCKIDSPQAVFGKDWGDVDAMDERLNDEDVKWHSMGGGAVGFWVGTGINW